jgi:hypothetical protein
MTSRFFALGTLGVLIAVAAVSAVGPARPHLVPGRSPGESLLHVSGGRSRQQTQSPTASKMDAALAGISRHLGQVRADHALADLHTINPAARFRAAASDSSTPMVLVDAVTRGDPQQLKVALVGVGLEHPVVFANDVGGWLPLTKLDAATALTELHSIRAAMPHTRTGVVTSQGDFVQHSDVVRSANNLTGAGVTVGVLSDSFDCYAIYAEPDSGVPASGAAGYAYNGFTATYADDIASGDLPSGVTVLEEANGGGNGCLSYGQPIQTPFGDEGRAMLQIIHDVAPGAGLAFYTAEDSEADFAHGIGQLAKPVAEGGAGATVIADDVGYFDEPFFQDGIVAQAIDTVEAAGVAYFSAAGNDGNLGYNNIAPTFATLSTSSPNSGEHLLNFDTSGNTTTVSLPVTIPEMAPGEFVAIVLEWDQPYVTGAPSSGGSTNQLDLCITGAAGDDDIDNEDLEAASCTGANSVGSDPVQVMLIDNPADAAGNSTQETLNIQVGLVSGTPPGRIKVAVEDDGLGSTITSFATNSGTLQGHPGAAGAVAVGAAFFLNTPACGDSPPELEYFSSLAGDPILFDVNGARQSAVVRQKPNVVGPDGGYDTFLGFTLASDDITDNSSITGCQNNVTNANNVADTYPNFFGTSAATPHVASIAALLLQANPSLTPAQILSALQSTAIAMNGSAPNYSAGYGFVQANLAASSVPAVVPAEPSLSLTETSVEVGSTTTLSWTSANDQSCTASGSWSGPQNTSGTETLTPTAVGSETYSLLCSNTAGNSPTASVTLTVTPLTAPVAPTLTLGASSVVAGSSTTITWSSANATSCTASGSWTGTLATSGTQTLTPTTAGSDTYSLTCANGAGSSPASSATLTVTAASSGGGGGGALGLESLLGLALLSGIRARKSLRARRWA